MNVAGHSPLVSVAAVCLPNWPAFEMWNVMGKLRVL